MAENKKGFILYADILEDIKDLVIDDRQDGTNNAGELFLMILEYVNDLNPEAINKDVRRAFNPIKRQLKRDLDKWTGIREKRSIAGKASAEARANKREQVLTRAESAEQTPTNPTVIVNDNVIVSDSVTVSVSDTVNEKEKKKKKGMFNMSDVINPFENMDGFTELWGLWVSYRKEKRISAYKPIGLQGAYKKLWELSDGSMDTATKIVHESISNGWTGLFELKNNGRKNEKRDYKALDKKIDAELARRANAGNS